jgi:hypothetical protein
MPSDLLHNYCYDLAPDSVQAVAMASSTAAMGLISNPVEHIVLFASSRRGYGFVVTTVLDKPISHRTFSVDKKALNAQLRHLRDVAILLFPPKGQDINDGSQISVTIYAEQTQLTASWWTFCPDEYKSLGDFVDWLNDISGLAPS